MKLPLTCLAAGLFFVTAGPAGAVDLPLGAAKMKVLAVQVMLDRRNFSPGVIDGVEGSLYRKALSGFQEAHGLPATGQPDDATMRALEGEIGRMDVLEVALTASDLAGPFTQSIPDDAEAQAKLPALNYTSIEEALAEKYHTTPALLKALNPGATFGEGSRIRVPATPTATVYHEQLAADASSAEPVPSWRLMLRKLSVVENQLRAAKVVVDKSDRLVRVFDVSDRLIAQFPATIGSSHDPLPIGEWKITGVATMPPFRYNPELFWDVDDGNAKIRLPPGPNGPVGVAWIDLSKEHYGIHGTGEPAEISNVASHGCIRLTNWDVARLVQMVRPGVPAVLQE